MTTSPEYFDDIAHTALFTANWRRYSGTPHAGAIFTAAEELWQTEGYAMPDLKLDQTYHGPTMEVRQLVGNELLGRMGATQVLDLAAGLSPRALQWTAKPGRRYVEVDLLIMSNLKRKVLGRLEGPAGEWLRGTLDKNYHLEAGSALDPETIDRATRHFDQEHPVAVFCEGFLHYLNNDQRAQVAANVANVLRQFRGVWITDMPHRRNAADAPSAPTFQRLGTGRDVEALAFSNRREALQFFAEQGFSTSEQDTLEYSNPEIIGKLVSPSRLGIDQAEVAQRLRPWAMHVLRLSGIN